MRLRIVAGHGLDTPLEFCAVLPKVTPQPRYLSPIPAAEITRTFFRTSRHAMQMFTQIVCNQLPFALAHMRKITNGVVVLRFFRMRRMLNCHSTAPPYQIGYPDKHCGCLCERREN